jgi:membrane-associated phospholipid phosphatase
MKIHSIARKIRLFAYLKALLITLFVLFGFIFLGHFVQKDPLVISFDSYFYELIHRSPHFSLMDMLIKPFNFNFLPWGGTMPSYFYFMVGIFFIYLAVFKRHVLGWAILAVVIALLIDKEVTSIHWDYVHRDRPFLTLPNTVDSFGQTAWKGWNSYPSGHARETALFATIISAFLPRIRWLMILFTIFIGYSRLYLGAHYPTDVLSGIFIGYLLAHASLILIGELQIMYKSWEGRRHAADQDPGAIDSEPVQAHIQS